LFFVLSVIFCAKGMKKIMKKIFLGGLILIAVLFLALAFWVEFVACPFPDYRVNIDHPIDRLEIWKITDDEKELIRTVESPAKIGKYIRKYRWENVNAICCMEDTRYIFEEYASGESVGSSYYAQPFARYNNLGFTLYQLWLILGL